MPSAWHLGVCPPVAPDRTGSHQMTWGRLFDSTVRLACHSPLGTRHGPLPACPHPALLRSDAAALALARGSREADEIAVARPGEKRRPALVPGLYSRFAIGILATAPTDPIGGTTTLAATARTFATRRGCGARTSTASKRLSRSRVVSAKRHARSGCRAGPGGSPGTASVTGLDKTAVG